jgi:hypothetical protein
MGQKRIVSPETPVRSFPTPNIEDLVVIQDVDSRLPGYKPLDYGAPHPDQTRFKGAKLVYQEPIDNSDTFVRRIYATDRVNQDAYNYGIKLSAGSPDHPIYIRSYVLPRADYQPLPDGSPDPGFPGAYLVEEEMAPVEGELNSLYVRVTRAFETLPGPVLTSFETNDAGQKVTVTTQRKSSAGYSLPAASATSSPSAQAEDAGVVTEQVRNVPSIFTRKQFSAERPDMLPQKFRAAVPDVETSELVPGTAEQPTLLQGDISASQTQQSLFVKQVSRRSRTSPTYPRVITETTATRSGQLATVTSTLDDSIQTADTGPLVESSEVTDLGDGRSIKVTTEVDQIFEQSSFTRAREDMTPGKFRALLTQTVEERTVGGDASLPATLGPGQLSKTEEQVTTERKRVRTQQRDTASSGTLSGAEYTTALGGGVASVTERYGSLAYTEDEPEFGTVSYSQEPIGDGNYVSRHAVLPAPPELSGQIYDDQLDIVVPFTRQVVPADNDLLGQERVAVSPEDALHSTVQELDVEAYRAKVLDEHYTVVAYINMELPDRLLDVTAVRTFAYSSGSATATGTSYSIEASGTGTNTIDIRFRVKNGYTGPVPATRHIFFLDKQGATFNAVLSKCNALAFPALFPEPVTITTVGGSVTRRVSSSISVPVEGTPSSASGTSFQNSLSSSIVTIPPTLHEGLTVNTQDVTLTGTGSAGSGTITAAAPQFTGAFSPSTIPATSPTSFAPGNYLINVDTESFRYGLVRVTALVAHISSTYVN